MSRTGLTNSSLCLGAMSPRREPNAISARKQSDSIQIKTPFTAHVTCFLCQPFISRMKENF